MSKAPYGRICGVLIAVAQVVACKGPAPQTTRIDQSENEIARRFLASHSRLNRSWQATSVSRDRSEFSAIFRLSSRSEEGGDKIVSAVILPENGRVPRQDYDQLLKSVRYGRIRTDPKDPATGLIPIDQGQNVVSVRFLGPVDDALHCEILGFHTPTFLGSCDWVYRGASFHIEGDPEILSSAMRSRHSLETLWSTTVR